MGTIVFENNTFIYASGKQKTVLLDCTDFLSNKSRLPLHSYSDDLTLPELILKLTERNERLCAGTGEERLALSNLLLDVLVSSCLIKTAFPVNALEIGSVSGVISYHLATLLGKFHPDSLLCCVSDSIGNESENQWLDRIILVEEPPRLSFLAADYHDTHLQENSFDLIVINGSITYEDPNAVLCEAERLIKNNGTIICCSDNFPLLEHIFKTKFPNRMAYPLPGHINIMRTQLLKSIEKESPPSQMEIIYDFIEEVKQLISENRRVDTNSSLNKIQKYLNLALKAKNTDIKIQLIDLRDKLLDYMLF